MDPETACRLLNDELILPPGWAIEAHPATHVHGGEIHVTVRTAGVDTAPEMAIRGYPVANENFAGFFVTVGDVDTPDDLVKRFYHVVVGRVREHEDREMLRWRSGLRAPLNPHTVDGRRLWGDLVADATYGYPVFVPTERVSRETAPAGSRLGS